LAITSRATAIGDVPLGISCMRVLVRSIGWTCAAREKERGRGG
jgi:hypothetical protein